MKEYSKIAIGKTSDVYHDFPIDDSGLFVNSIDIIIKYNLSFVPKNLILIGCNANYTGDNGYSNYIPRDFSAYYSKDNKITDYLNGMIYLDTFEYEKLTLGDFFQIYIEIKKFNDKEIVLTISHNNYDGAQIQNIRFDKFKFIAIG